MRASLYPAHVEAHLVSFGWPLQVCMASLGVVQVGLGYSNIWFAECSEWGRRPADFGSGLFGYLSEPNSFGSLGYIS